MEKKIIYSVITPTYNRADCIIRCLESVERARQALPFRDSIEHVIVDDGSSDSTCTIVSEYVKQHPYVVFIKFEQNKGTNAARNEAIRNAHGKWCIILDSDDYFCDTALYDINNTIQANPFFGHYVFAADDMQEYYKNNLILKGATQKVLSYPDFLNGYVNCDFIHVMQREVLLRHPFNEQLRIYEGLFFLLFYRDVRLVLFTNKVVTVRERQRADSVTRNTIRTNHNVIQRSAINYELMLEYFESDLSCLGMNRTLHSIKMSLYENYVLLEKYSEAKALKITDFTGKKEKMLYLIRFLHIGGIYRFLLQSYLLLKYNVLKVNLKN